MGTIRLWKGTGLGIMMLRIFFNMIIYIFPSIFVFVFTYICLLIFKYLFYDLWILQHIPFILFFTDYYNKNTCIYCTCTFFSFHVTIYGVTNIYIHAMFCVRCVCFLYNLDMNPK